MMRPRFCFLLMLSFFIRISGADAQDQPMHMDHPYVQDYSIKYVLNSKSFPEKITLKKVGCDRNGNVQVLSSKGILKNTDGQFLYPGELVMDLSYRPMLDKKISDLDLYQNQFVYLDGQAILSNAWAGKLYSTHSLPAATQFCAGDDFAFLVADDKTTHYVKDSKTLVSLTLDAPLVAMVFDQKRNGFWLLSEHGVSFFDVKSHTLRRRYKGSGFTCFSLANDNKELVIGTHNGYFTINPSTGAMLGEIKNKLPCNDLTVVKEIDNKIWFGSTNGAFMLQPDGKYKYYASKRWLPSNKITDIAAGKKNRILILTDLGLGVIHFEEMSLHEKAMYYEQQVRSRHIRLGFNATITGMKNGDVSTGSLVDSDNDGLWTSMYLGAEVFRYAATKSPEALENCRESLDAMERLYTVTHLKGFPARSFERRGYEISDAHSNNPEIKAEYPGNASMVSPFSVWRHSEDTVWDWKSTTSSDEAIGHMFVFGVIAELIDVPDIKNKAIQLMDALMTHIVEHEMYMIDWNGKPTTWGRWNPEYVNAMPKNVGDRKITSSNITSMLQTAYHFTGKEIFKEKALELLNKYGYLENLMRPMKEIGYAPGDASHLAKDLSSSWNHSDDEMYFLGYWGLYRYALNDTLKEKFKAAILDHWEIERPEKEGAWDIFTAITGVKDFDLSDAVWYLQKYPMDLIDWRVINSTRKDIEFIPQNFRRQTIKEVLPPDELPISRHNGNRFDLDDGDEHGGSEYSAGDIWLLPYWMGRYLKIISEPADKKNTEKPAIDFRTQQPTVLAVHYRDQAYAQVYSIKNVFADGLGKPIKIISDRNQNIRILANSVLFKPRAGQLLEPGTLVQDASYRSISDKKISAICLYKNELVFADDKVLQSNAWAGKLYVEHGMPAVSMLAGGQDFDFMISDGTGIKFIRNGKVVWSMDAPTVITHIQYEEDKNLFWLLSKNKLYSFSPDTKQLQNVFSDDGFTCFKILSNRILIGTHHGYIELAYPYTNAIAKWHDRLPAIDITVIEEVGGDLWFGTKQGAFIMKNDGQFNYYASERWLPGNDVVDIAAGNDGVLVLTTKGLGKIGHKQMTMEEKAEYYESIVRQRHIRYGFYCDFTNMQKGNLATAQMGPHDSDNIWTSMYLSAELFRYLVTHSEEAKQNCLESMDAMERLFQLSGIKGLFGRCIERSGVMEFKDEIRDEDSVYWYPGYTHTPSSWRYSANKEWDWRGSASIDQADGQYFALTMLAQYMDDSNVKQRAIKLIDELTGYVLANGMELIDADGRPTLWGRWGPEYVNRFPDMVGDKKLYSSNVIAFLQIAYHFTGKEKYKQKALELLYKYKYLENLARPVSEIGPAPATTDKWSQLMSGTWNCSDDEMYFLLYWGLYPYALNNQLKIKYKEAIKDHWEMMRPEKEALWNICYGAITGSSNFDLDETIWELKKMPLDLITWSVQNSNRKDLVFVKENSLERYTDKVLPPDERPENKHNRNLFKLDENGQGASELGGGDVYLLPYWMARYFGMISGSEQRK